LSAVAPFNDVKSAVQATVEIMQTGLPIARIEFLDEKSIHANNIYNKMNLEETPTLFLEFHGSKKTIDQQAELASKKILINIFYSSLKLNFLIINQWRYAIQTNVKNLIGQLIQKSGTNFGKLGR
jgi:FAD/FMN-containing dehydrogenase